jgi:ABC-type uncharacterized transport system ATPase subunit
MYKYDIWSMYDGSEYLQNILLKISKNNIIIILNHDMYFCHDMLWKIYNPWPKNNV